MKISIKNKILSLFLAALFALTATLSVLPTETSAESLLSYSDTDLKADYDESSATKVDLSSVNSTYEIKAGGTYVLSGSLSGQIVVSAGKNDKVQLVLNNASVTNQSGPALYGLTVDKIVLTLLDGTENSFVDGTDYTLDEEGANAAIYSKTDLAINGTGTLNVQGNTAHGIVSKDELTLVSGTLNVQAKKDALRGKDSVLVKDGTYNLSAGSDGIVSNDSESTKGIIEIDGGQFVISAANDGIQAENIINIFSGSFEITTGAGSSIASLLSSDLLAKGGDTTSGATTKSAQQPPQAFGRTRPGENKNQNTSAESQKALKAGVEINTYGGGFVLNAAEDAIHSDGNVSIHDGVFSISAGDDGIHADKTVLIKSGIINILNSYEGIEGEVVQIDGGEINVNASDDAINASNDSGNNRSVLPGVEVIINGGTIVLVGGYDAIDSNGSLTVNGGSLDLTSLRAGGGNAAIDLNGGFTHNGGTVKTNDGSENSRNQQGAPGMRQRR